MTPFRKAFAMALCEACLVLAQQDIAPVRPAGPAYKRPYLPASVPDTRLGNSARLAGLIKAGKLYLSAKDAVRLALENNIDIEIARYNKPQLEWQLERAEAGGALPGVQSNASQASSNASGQGVLGSQAAAGVGAPSASATRGASTATVAQVGPVTANLDPSLQASATFSHRTVPQPDVVQSIIPVLIQGQRVYSGSYQQGFLAGGGVSVSFNDHFLDENAPTDFLNPSSSAARTITVQQNLLQGLGRAVNERNIVVAKRNLEMTDLNFRAQVSGVVTRVLDAYYQYAASYDDVQAKNEAIAAAMKLLSDTKRRLELGDIAPLDVTSADNQVALTVQTYADSLASERQKELQLKTLLSRNGLADAALLAASVIPLDRISVPANDDLAPAKELAKKALETRADLEVERRTAKNAEISALGTVNGLLPTAQVFAAQSATGLAGAARVVNHQTADPYFVGGIGDALGQIARNNFPTENVGVFGNIQIYDRQAEADYAIDQLQLRQQQLKLAKDLNQAQVDVTNAVVALRQARVRYEAASKATVLQQELWTAEQKKLELGSSTALLVLLQQRDFVLAQATELSAMATWQSARLNLDQVTGATLEANGVSLGETRSGKLAELSTLPEKLPQPAPDPVVPDRF